MRRNCKEVLGIRLQVSGSEGQSLIEVVISIALAAILAISLITTTLVTQRTSQSARNNTEATKLAQELIEQLRVFRDRKGYNQIPDSACRLDSQLIPDNWTLYSTGCDNDYKVLGTVTFYRTFTVDVISSLPDPEKKLVTVVVYWDESGGRKQVTHDTIFSNWESF